MKIFSNHIAGKLIVFIIAFQVLNMSIDSPSAWINQNVSHQKINYIDTYIEYFAEVILKYENAIPEAKNRQHKELQHHQHLNIIFENITYATILSIKEKSLDQKLNYNDRNAYQFIKEINPPPPKFS